MRLPILFCAITLTGCFGYSTMYTVDRVDFSGISVEEVRVVTEEKRAGSRRVAQHVSQKLRDMFTGGGRYTLNVFIKEEESAVAVRRDAIESRLQLVLTAQMYLVDDAGETVLHTEVSSQSPYNVEETPYATDAGRLRARFAAADMMAEDVIHRISMFLNGQSQQMKP